MLSSTSLVLGLSLLATPAMSFEWAGVFDVTGKNTVQWIAQKVDGKYADADMDIVVIPIADSTHASLHAQEAAATTLLTGTCASTPVGTTFTASATACYELVFDTTSFETVWDVDVTGHNFVAIFAQHVPIEFEDTTHYLRWTDGTDIEPIHELPEEPEPEKPWGLVILSCVLVNLMTFIGVALIGCGIIPSKISPTTHGALSGFASGALLGCAVFLILVEAMHLIGTGEGYEETDVIWRWGSAFLGGFLVSLVVFVLQPDGANCMKFITPPGAEGKDPADDEAAKNNKLMTTLFAICAGDFMHNIVDGFAIGFAFKMCEESLGWTILIGTMYHEIAQEVGDFALLTHDVGLSTKTALLWNFLAGTSVIIGGIIAVAIDISDVTTGVLLAFGGGTYVYLACSEALPRALAYSDLLKDKAFKSVKCHYLTVLGAFVAGAVAIGLVLIKHEHCVPGGGAHAH